MDLFYKQDLKRNYVLYIQIDFFLMELSIVHLISFIKHVLFIYIDQYKSYDLGALAILAGKTVQHYEYAFKTIKDNIIQYKVRPGSFYPTFIHIDKELAIINACKKIFPQTKIKLCYFHFSNNIKKRINNLVFKDLFNSNPIALQCVFGCKALSFIPEIYIIPVFERI